MPATMTPRRQSVPGAIFSGALDHMAGPLPGPRAVPRLCYLPLTSRLLPHGEDVSRLADVVTGGAHVNQPQAQRRANPLPVTDPTAARFVANVRASRMPS